MPLNRHHFVETNVLLRKDRSAHSICITFISWGLLKTIVAAFLLFCIVLPCDSLRQKLLIAFQLDHKLPEIFRNENTFVQ